jgi:hypothetical protein
MGEPVDTPDPGSGRRGTGRGKAFSRRVTFGVLVAACLALGSTYVLWSESRQDEAASNTSVIALPGSAASPSANAPAGTGASSQLMFQHVARDDHYAQIALVPANRPHAPRTHTSMTCERLYFAAGRGLCLLPKRTVIGQQYVAKVFDAEFVVRKSLTLPGIVNRARVSPDGRFGATTGFVTGDSYADATFSTRTFVIDMRTGEAVGALEDFDVWREGRRIRSIDFNFWGVTFERDGTRFYATLATRGKTHLVKGDVSKRRLEVIRENVECPSLSPNGRRIAFKKQIGGRGQWRFHVLDLRTMKETPLSETRSIDDQVEWLDENRILYGSFGDIWMVRADGRGSPQEFLPDALSPSVVRT